jgi:hypothetical protein
MDVRIHWGSLRSVGHRKWAREGEGRLAGMDACGSWPEDHRLRKPPFHKNPLVVPWLHLPIFFLSLEAYESVLRWTSSEAGNAKNTEWS